MHKYCFTKTVTRGIPVTLYTPKPACVTHFNFIPIEGDLAERKASFYVTGKKLAKHGCGNY